MSVSAIAGVTILIVIQFLNVKGCAPEGSSCLFNTDCCRGVCTWLFFCKNKTGDSTVPPISPPPTVGPMETNYTTPSIKSTEFVDSLTPSTTESTDYWDCTTPSTTESTEYFDYTTPSTTESIDYWDYTTPSTIESTDYWDHTTPPTTESTTYQMTPETTPLYPTEPWNGKCRIPGSICTDTMGCCTWTCQIYKLDSKLGHSVGVCPVPLVPWPPFDRNAFPWNMIPAEMVEDSEQLGKSEENSNGSEEKSNESKEKSNSSEEKSNESKEKSNASKEESNESK